MASPLSLEPAVQRADHREAWIRLRAAKMGQLDPFSRVGAGKGNEGGPRRRRLLGALKHFGASTY